MAKYDPLEAYLRGLSGDVVRLTFDEINGILQSKLPRSAYEHPPFWSNTEVGSSHVWADAWQRAGWRTVRYNLEQQFVDFRRFSDESSPTPAPRTGPQGESAPSGSGESRNEDSGDTSEERQLATIWSRRGQRKFRERLLRAYGCVCAVSGSTVEALLEAAHIVPHALETNYAITNGLLLRADIHTLFDLHLITIDSDGRVCVARSLEWTEYAQFRGRRLVAYPLDKEECPSADQLKRHHNLFVAREEALVDQSGEAPVER
ncbi:HNH endonuclease signature motif containing protein [Paraburkholderia sp. J8-2]|uniref:HNH endonuclease n=1 Tax=Paraburkholderia sp. J8-2 TaxID=2805440 RepID=UPI002AB5E933|nr:HNH endonuclease signature motif containing protein [Paraburkholderia sp. J8-2]